MSIRYKPQGKIGLFDEELAINQSSEMGNQLGAINKAVDIEYNRTLLESKMLNTNIKNNAGAKPFDVVVMFKIMLLQCYYYFRDHQVEYQSVDLRSFQSFLYSENGVMVYDEKTI